MALPLKFQHHMDLFQSLGSFWPIPHPPCPPPQLIPSLARELLGSGSRECSISLAKSRVGMHDDNGDGDYSTPRQNGNCRKVNSYPSIVVDYLSTFLKGYYNIYIYIYTFYIYIYSDGDDGEKEGNHELLSHSHGHDHQHRHHCHQTRRCPSLLAKLVTPMSLGL